MNRRRNADPLKDVREGVNTFSRAVDTTENVLGGAAALAGAAGLGYGLYRLFGSGKSKPKPGKTLGRK